MTIINQLIPAALFLSLSGLASADVLLTAAASPGSLNVGGVSTVTVTLSDASTTSNTVAGYQFDIDFNPAILQETALVEEGYFANNGLTGLTTASVNNTAGTITLIADAAATPEDPAAGDPLVGITFKAIGTGSSPVTIANDIVSDAQFSSITATTTNTTVIVQAATTTPEPQSILLATVGLLGTALSIARSSRRPAR